jgi:hypothetical protein
MMVAIDKPGLGLTGEARKIWESARSRHQAPDRAWLVMLHRYALTLAAASALGRRVALDPVDATTALPWCRLLDEAMRLADDLGLFPGGGPDDGGGEPVPVPLHEEMRRAA